MTRNEILTEIKQYFDIDELVCNHTFKNGEKMHGSFSIPTTSIACSSSGAIFSKNRCSATIIRSGHISAECAAICVRW